MPLNFLLDTNVVSEPTKLVPREGILQMIDAKAGQIAISAPSWQELLFGSLRLPPKRRRRLASYLENKVRKEFPIFSYDRHAAEWHAREHARLVAEGRTPAFVDGQIAAVAYVNRLTLVTMNTRDFDEFKGLTIQNWAQE